MSNKELDEEISNRIKVGIEEAIEFAKEVLEAGLVPMFHGSPGTGKSKSIEAMARLGKLKLIDLRLAQFDPTDMNGFPSINQDTGRSCYFPPEDFPLEGDPLPAGYNGWLILFDEITSAPQSVVAAAYKIILDRMIGMRKLHPNVHMMAAGNMTTDRAIANTMSTAMQSRLVHFEIKSVVEPWLKKAVELGFDNRVIAYVSFTGQVNNFDPDHNDYTFVCERTLEFVSKLIRNKPQVTYKDTPLIAGAIGVGPANDFVTFCQIYKELPDLPAILANPDIVPVPTDPGACHALTEALAKQINLQNISTFMIFIKRMSIEFQAITLKGLLRHDPNMLFHPEITQWSLEHASRIIK